MVPTGTPMTTAPKGVGEAKMAMADAEELQRATQKRDYLRVAEVAELFHVSTKTVVRWATEGKLPHVLTLGGHRRFPRADIEKVVEGLQRGG